MSKILEVKHHAPYDGAFWEWNYFWAEMRGSKIKSMRPIYAKNQPDPIPVIMNGELVDVLRSRGSSGSHHVMTVEIANGLLDGSYHGWVFDEAELHSIDKSLHKHVPNNHIPAFWRAMDDMGKKFTWKCETCGETTAEPLYIAGYRGNGGVGIEICGWVCENCPDPEEEYEDEE